MSYHDVTRCADYPAGDMARWQPNSRERLQGAALELFSEQGFESTTVADIAGRVGVTTRTFFRHFADKRDVLFAGARDLESLLTEQIVEAPSELGPLDAIAAALAAFGTESTVPRHYLRQRQAVIASSAELTERELMKFDALAAAFCGGLHRRGVTEPAASLAAHAGITIFRSAYARWTSDDTTDMATIVNDVLDEFRAAVAF
jgi:AcrR family transcriptional regulator